MSDTTTRRLVELESRLTDHERTIELLNEAVIEQGAAIDRLSERVRSLQENLAGGDGSQGGSEPPPPHY